MPDNQPCRDYRQEAAAYYDRFSRPPSDDVDFYRARVTSETTVLELGCGTGRVLVPLVESCGFILGLDHSPAMLTLCRRRLAENGIGSDRAQVETADITNFEHTGQTRKFDLIIAPFRVMQNLETDKEITALMRCIKQHLAREGEAILNTFNPVGGPDEVKAFWNSRNGRKPTWSKMDGDDTVTMTEVCTSYRDTPLTVFPEITYRRYAEDGREVGQAVLNIAMRVWYPDDLLNLISSHGFTISSKFGGYHRERWQEGSELVVAFRDTGTREPNKAAQKTPEGASDL